MTWIPINSEALVSIIIPYYNQPAFLAECVRSAKEQTYPNVQVIVVDDGSEVPADSVLRGFSDVLILRTENRGVSAARNLGFHRSSGSYLIFLDSDDRLLPGAIMAHLQALLEYPEAALSFGATKIIDAVGRTVRPAHICRPRKNYFLMLLECNPIASLGATMVRRSAFAAAGLFNDSFSGAADYDLYLRIARNAPLVRHTVCALEYRKHDANMSRAQERMLIETLAVLDRVECVLTEPERKRLPRARRRWKHTCHPSPTVTYKLRSLYYSLSTVLNVPARSYFGNRVIWWKYNQPPNN